MIRFLFLLLLVGCQEFTTWQTPKGGDFILKTPDGVLNTAELRGKTLFIFFGFLHCPYVCPTTVRELNRMMKSLTPEQQKKAVPIFISVDPERDTLPVLKEYFASMPNIIPATGTEEEVRKAIKLFGGDFVIKKGKTPDDTFVDHTSTVFVINRKGVWVNSLAFDADQKEFKRAYDIAYGQRPYWSEEARMERIRVLGDVKDCDLGKKNCEFKTESGSVYEVELSPRPVNHLKEQKMIVRSKALDLTPMMGDFVGIELAMGLIRPRLEKTRNGTWEGVFKLPTCDLRDMHWDLRLLLEDKQRENNEIRFHFTSINEFPEKSHK